MASWTIRSDKKEAVTHALPNFKRTPAGMFVYRQTGSTEKLAKVRVRASGHKCSSLQTFCTSMLLRRFRICEVVVLAGGLAAHRYASPG